MVTAIEIFLVVEGGFLLPAAQTKTIELRALRGPPAAVIASWIEASPGISTVPGFYIAQTVTRRRRSFSESESRRDRDRHAPTLPHALLRLGQSRPATTTAPISGKMICPCRSILKSAESACSPGTRKATVSPIRRLAGGAARAGAEKAGSRAMKASRPRNEPGQEQARHGSTSGNVPLDPIEQHLEMGEIDGEIVEDAR